VADQIPEECMQIWVVAPRGFRPSQWVDMLVDYDEAFEVDRYLVDRGYVDHHEILVIAAEMFDPKAEQADQQIACLWEVLGKVSRLGLTLNVHPEFVVHKPEWWQQLQVFLQTHPIPLEMRSVLHAEVPATASKA
jgi:hypothetical protein